MLKFVINYLKFLMNIYKSRKQKNIKLYNYIDLDIIENKFPKKVNRIIFIIPSMAKFSGWHTSILRLGTEVPYEMMATGLPVIEFMEGSFTSFFSEKCGILTDFNYKTLLEKMTCYLENLNLIEKCCQSAKEELKNLSWQKSGQQFINIIENLNKIGDNFND